MTCVKEDFKNRNLAEARQTIPRVFTEERSVQWKRNQLPTHSFSFLNVSVYVHTRRPTRLDPSLCVYLVDFTSVLHKSQIKGNCKISELFCIIRAANLQKKNNHFSMHPKEKNPLQMTKVNVDLLKKHLQVCCFWPWWLVASFNRIEVK